MNPSSLSDEMLSELICESQATLKKTAPSTKDVFDRLQKFGKIYSDLESKPEGVALLFQEPGSAAVRTHLVGRNLVIGRLPKGTPNAVGCDLAFEDDRMSRRHFEISLSDDLYVLRDLQSRNGTYLNGEPVKVQEIALKAGDIIFAGSLVFFFTGA